MLVFFVFFSETSVIRAGDQSVAAAVVCGGSSAASVSKQSLSGWGAGGGLPAFSGQSDALGVFGQVELRTLPGTGHCRE